MSNAVSCLCVWFCLHTILIKAKIWLRGSIPVLSPLIRQEGCQLWVLCCSLNSQTSPLNWTLELSMCMECLLCPALVFKFHRKGEGETGLVGIQQAACIWKVTAKCVIDSTSVVSVRGLERNMGWCKKRGGYNRRRGEEVGVIICHSGSDSLMI